MMWFKDLEIIIMADFGSYTPHMCLLLWVWQRNQPEQPQKYVILLADLEKINTSLDDEDDKINCVCVCVDQKTIAKQRNRTCMMKKKKKDYLRNQG